jgi:hypothetical protein
MGEKMATLDGKLKNLFAPQQKYKTKKIELVSVTE